MEPHPAPQVGAVAARARQPRRRWTRPRRARWRSCREWVPANASPMCGNSICQDRRFLHRLMPRAGEALPLPQPRRQHAQGTGAALGAARCWPACASNAAHTALSDVRDSIAELAYYRQHMGPARRACRRLNDTGGVGQGHETLAVRTDRPPSLALLHACCCRCPGRARAPDKPVNAYFRETWTTREGLPHNQVNAIAQTPDGYLWFGTWEGLVRYNGLEFHVFDRRNTPALQRQRHPFDPRRARWRAGHRHLARRRERAARRRLADLRQGATGWRRKK